MAEAAVEDRPHQKFYCHICNVQFENASAVCTRIFINMYKVCELGRKLFLNFVFLQNFTCPHCSGGFIEELEVSADNPAEVVDVDVTDDDDDEPYNVSQVLCCYLSFLQFISVADVELWGRLY